MNKPVLSLEAYLMISVNRCIVTGSSGFVGSKLVKVLRNFDVDVLELDMLNGFDITNWSQINSIKNFQVVFHLAAKSFVPDSYKYPRDFYYTNSLSTLNMLELCRLNNAKMIFASSYVYGIPKYLPIDENHPLDSINPYSQSKIICEKLCHGYNRDHNVPIIIIRPSNIYGPGQNKNFLIPTILNQLNTGKISLKDSKPKRDYIFIEDIIDIYIKAATFTGNNFEIFNAGFGVSFSVEQILDQILKLSGLQVQTTYSSSDRLNEVMDVVYCIEKAKEKLNWFPSVSFESGLQQTIKQYLC